MVRKSQSEIWRGVILAKIKWENDRRGPEVILAGRRACAACRRDSLEPRSPLVLFLFLAISRLTSIGVSPGRRANSRGCSGALYGGFRTVCTCTGWDFNNRSFGPSVKNIRDPAIALRLRCEFWYANEPDEVLTMQLGILEKLPGLADTGILFDRFEFWFSKIGRGQYESGRKVDLQSYYGFRRWVDTFGGEVLRSPKDLRDPSLRKTKQQNKCFR